MLNILVFSKQTATDDQLLFDLPEIDVRHLANLSDVSTRDPDWRPHVLVFRQVRRNELTRDEIDEAIRQFPLAARVMLYGPWCEGETRSGQPEQGLHRVSETNWRRHLEQAIRQFGETGTTDWHRPVAGLRQQPVDHSGDHSGPLNIAAISATPGFRETLGLFCDSRGWTLQGPNCATSCDVVVIECYYSVAEAIEREPEIRNQLGPRPVVVICGFPRQQDHERLTEAFSHYALLGKPFNNSDLHQAIVSLATSGKFGVYHDVA